MLKLFKKKKANSNTQIFSERVKAENSTISVVINTYNAQRMLEQTIQSVINADEIIICDMHSNDETIKIAEKYNCKIYFHEKLPQPDPARNFAISKATSDWILILDADEIIPTDLWDFLVNYSKNYYLDRLVVQIPRKNWFLDGFLEHVGSDSQLRFFKKGHLKYEDTGFVHVFPKPIDSLILNLENKKQKNLAIYHYSYGDFSEYLTRQNIYTSEELKKTNQTKIKKSVLNILLIFLTSFKTYIKNKNYKDGFRGFIWFLYGTFYKITVYIKQLEKQENFEKIQMNDIKIQK